MDGTGQSGAKESRGVELIGCSVMVAVGTSGGAGHAVEECGAELGLHVHPHFHFAPKWSDLESKGCGEAARRAW